jgi:dephospho-CoA kinase
MMPMETVNLIVLVGMPGAGKSFCVEYLKSKGWPSVYFGGITLDEIKKRGLEINPENEKFVREDIRAKEGKDAYALRIIAQIEKLVAAGETNIIVDGLYSWSEYKVFKHRFGDKAVIIAITAPRKVRHARLANRHVRPLTEKEVTAREYAEIENIEKGGPIANADYTIGNEDSTEQLIHDLEFVLKNLLIT